MPTLEAVGQARGLTPQQSADRLFTATAVWQRHITSMPDLTLTGASPSGQQAFTMAGIAPRDIDLLQRYDAFTINTILFLEDLGFCAKGEGGVLSCVHPGMYGIFALIEAVRQLRGRCGERQLPGLHTALAYGNGGTLSSQSTPILELEETL